MIQYTVSPAELAEANAALDAPNRSPAAPLAATPTPHSTRRGLAGWAIFIGLCVLVFLFLRWQGASSPPAHIGATLPKPTSPSMLQLFIGWGSVIFGMFLLLYVFLVDLCRLQRDSTIKNQKSLDWSDAEVTVTANNVVATYAWTAFESHVETANIFALRGRGTLVQVIPRHAFPNTDLIEDFRRCLRSHVPQLAKLYTP